MTFISGTSASAIWTEALQVLSQDDKTNPQDSRIGPTREILHAHFCITNIRKRWVSTRNPPINPAFAIAEYFWILAGSNVSSFINRWFPNLPDFQGRGPTYHGAYGYRIRHTFGFDQLEHAYQVLSENPDTRQVIIQIWNPGLDFPKLDGAPAASDIPCNICSLPKVRDGRLEWLQLMRSNDIFRGLPYNIVQFSMLQETLSGWLQLEPGEYHQISDSLHYYEKDKPEFSVDENSIITDDQQSIALPKDEHQRVLEEMHKVLTVLASETLTENAFSKTISDLDLPEAYSNMTSIAAAEIARREKWYDAMEGAVNQCTDSVLSVLWSRWEKRVTKV